MLLKTINEIKAILPVGTGNDFNRIKPHIENAENRYIKPLLGLDIYNQLTALYIADESQNPDETEILHREMLKKVQFAEIHLAFFLGFDFLNVSVTDAGFQRMETERTKGLFKYQEDAIKTFFAEAGFNALDDILTFINLNISFFELFENSDYFNRFKTSFLPTVKTVEDIPFNIHQSNLILLALQPAIAYIDDTTIRSTFGPTIYSTVKTEMVKPEPLEKVVLLLPYIRKALIYLATAMLMEETGGTLYNKGLYFDRNEDQQRAKVVKSPATDERVSILVNRNKAIGNGYLESLKIYLAENWSDEYSGQSGSVFKRDNTNKKAFFA